MRQNIIIDTIIKNGKIECKVITRMYKIKRNQIMDVEFRENGLVVLARKKQSK